MGASLVGARFNTSNLEGAVLIGADLTGATVTGSNLKGADLTGANLTAATFSNVNMKGAIGLNTATLTGTVWVQTTCPNGVNSGPAGGSCEGRW